MMCCLIVPIVGLLSALLGYLLGKSSADKKIKECKEECEKKINKSQTLNARLEKDLQECISKKSVVSTSTDKSLGIVSDAVALIPFDAETAKTVFGKKIKENDLTIIEGIGPKIQELFNHFDIKTWKELSEASVERCQEILDSKGAKYRVHNPGTWPRQAKKAYEGKWKELLKWQDELDGGVE